MLRRFATLLVLLCAAVPLRAAPLDPALQQQLMGIYDSYNKALAGGKLQDALALRSAATRARAQKEMKTAKDRQGFLEMAKMMVPDKVEVRHATISKSGDKARMRTLASKTIPPGKPIPGAPPPGTTAQGELTLSFVKQNGSWKLDDLLYGGDPSAIVACKDDSNEPMQAYGPDKEVSLGGPIARVDFKPDYTVVVVRVVDEETCAFLPNREEIAKHGLDPAKLVPYAIVDLKASPHRTNHQKVLIERIKILEED